MKILTFSTNALIKFVSMDNNTNCYEFSNQEERYYVVFPKQTAKYAEVLNNGTANDDNIQVEYP